MDALRCRGTDWCAEDDIVALVSWQRMLVDSPGSWRLAKPMITPIIGINRRRDSYRKSACRSMMCITHFDIRIISSSWIPDKLARR